MGYGEVESSDVLAKGPLFSDEIQWPRGLTPEIKNALDLQNFRITPPRNAVSGIVAIYFRPKHRSWAVVRYADRYRWMMEIICRQGLSGRLYLERQGLTTDDIGLLMDILPRQEQEYPEVVYDFLWKNIANQRIIELAQALNDHATTFTSSELIGKHENLHAAHHSTIRQFIRSHLIQSEEKDLKHAHIPGDRSAEDLKIDPNKSFQLTPQGRLVIRGIVEEYQRIINVKDFSPLLIRQDKDLHGHVTKADNEGTEDKLSQDSILEDISAEIDSDK